MSYPGYPIRAAAIAVRGAHPAVRQSARSRCPRGAEQAAAVPRHRRRRASASRSTCSSFGPVFGGIAGAAVPTFYFVIAPLLAGLLAGVSLLPKQDDKSAVAAVLAVLGFLLLILVVLADGPSIDWGFYPFIVFSVLQAIAAVAKLLLDAGIITAPAPKPKYEQQAVRLRSARRGTTASRHRAAPAAAAAARWLRAAVRRRRLPARSIDGRLPRARQQGAPQQRTSEWSADPAHRIPGVRSPAGAEFGADGRVRSAQSGSPDAQQPQQQAPQQSAPPPS